MKQRKRSYTGRLFYDFRGLERTLEGMALKGWKLKKLNNNYIEYEKIEPQPLKYTVTYFGEASEFRPVPTENQEVFVDYCRESGWDLVAKWTQMLIFCSEEANPTPIDTDPVAQLAAMHKTMKKGMLPASYVQIGTFLLLVASRIYSVFSMPEYFYASNSSVLMAIIFILTLCYFITIPLKYFAWHRRAVQEVEAGGEIPAPKWSSKLDKFLALGFISIAVVYFGLTFLESDATAIPIYGGFALFFVLIFWLTSKLRKSGLLAKVWMRIVVVVVVTIASTVILSALLFTSISMGLFSSQDLQPKLDEPLPLTLEAFTDVDVSGYFCENNVRESFLLKWSDCRQRSEDFSKVWLNYEVFETQYPFIYNQLLADKMRINSNEKDLDVQYKTNWREVALPHVSTAYQCYRGDTPSTYDYLLCFGTNIVEMRFDSDFTPEQVDTAIGVLAQQLG